MLLIVAALIALERFGRRRDFAVSAQDTRRVSHITLAGPARWVATAACLAPVMLGFLLPAGYLVREVVGRGLLTASTPTSSATPSPRSPSPATATAITLALGFSAVATLRYVKHR